MKKTKLLTIRVTNKEMGRLKTLAKVYAGGNISRWVLYQSLMADRTYVKSNEFREKL